MDYFDFELEISPQRDGVYEVRARSLGGESRGVLELPFRSVEDRELRLDELDRVLRPGSGRRVPDRGQEVVAKVGEDLFEALMAGDVGGSYRVSRSRAASEGKGLRLKLRLRAPELASLPWEFVRDPLRDEYLGLSSWTPIVRYLDSPQEVQPLKVDPPVRILGMVASPADLPRLDVRLEKQLVDKALERLVAAGAVDLYWLEGQTWRDLEDTMNPAVPWHIFHFIGHGRFDRPSDEGQIALADERGNAHYLSASDLATLLTDQPSLRLAVLNACEGATGGTQDILSSSASILVRRGLPAVVAMQYEISDAAAIEFARTFYSSIAAGSPIDTSLAQARRSIRFSIPGSFEWATPVLYMHASDGVLFHVHEGPEQKAAAELATKRRPSTQTEPLTQTQPPTQTEPPTEPKTLRTSRPTARPTKRQLITTLALTAILALALTTILITNNTKNRAGSSNAQSASTASSKTATSTTSSTPVQTAPNPASSSGGSKTYSAARLPFTFQYPGNWSDTTSGCTPGCDASVDLMDGPNSDTGLEIQQVSAQTERSCLEFSKVAAREKAERHSGLAMIVFEWSGNGNIASSCTGNSGHYRFYTFALRGNRSLECYVSSPQYRAEGDAACSAAINSIKPT